MARRYTEEEVALVLKRAAELQAQGGGSGDARSLSLGDVEAAAGEAGIDRALVRQAARELRRPFPTRSHSSFLGGPTQIRIERVIDGEVPEEIYEVLVEEIRSHVGEIGTVSTLGRSLAWTSGPAMQGATSSRVVHVSVAARGGKTTLRIEEKLGMLIGGLYGGLLGGVGGGGTVIPLLPPLLGGMPWLLPITLTLWFGGVFALTRALYTKKSSEREAQALALMERMLDLCEDAINERALPAPAPG